VLLGALAQEAVNSANHEEDRQEIATGNGYRFRSEQSKRRGSNLGQIKDQRSFAS